MQLSKHTKQDEFQTLDELLSVAGSRKNAAFSYAGDVTPEETFHYLKSNGGLLLDVRTVPEWQFTGIPDLSETPGAFATISWKTYPTFTTNPQFLEQLAAVKNLEKETPIFCICRSGGRSLDAAIAATEAGYSHCFNVVGGFEGEPDAEGHRGTQQGWKAAKLPWRQG